MRAIAFVLFFWVIGAAWGEGAPGTSIAVRLSSERLHEMSLVSVGQDTVEVRTTGSDPFLYTETFVEGINFSEHPILSFEYFSLTGAGEVQVFLVPFVRESLSVHGGSLLQSEGWSKFSVDLAPALAKASGKVTGLRIDFGRRAGKTVRLRNIVLRGTTDAERRLEARKTERKQRAFWRDRGLKRYLDSEFTCVITRVSLDEAGITVEGRVGGNRDSLFLVEVPVYTDIGDMGRFGEVAQVLPDEEGRFSLRIARHTGGADDRLFSRWAVARKTAKGITLVSHARYADAVKPKWDLPDERPQGRKGLGGFGSGRPMEDIEDLGISAVTVNILLDGFMRSGAGSGRSVYEYCGRVWYTDDAAVARLDRTLLEAEKRGLIVSAIILLGQAGEAAKGEFRRMAAHPDADPAGIYVMPNLTSREGFAAYSAALNFLAERYSRPDKKCGRIHHWILHNEVNSGWVWTNMGEVTALRYMDTYHRSMRVAHLIARSYNPHARVYISLEHNWTRAYSPRCYPGRELLELLLEFSRLEGDFDWGLAYHPYPENLGNPRSWEDESATFDFDTLRITFRNIEVLDAWMKRPEARFLGERVRDVQFTEQGPNSPDYSEESLREQAAAMAYVWKKMEGLESISMFHFHNWVDNRGEGGLRIGLRKYPDDADDPLGRKPIWYVFQALGTDGEDAAIGFAKEVIEISDWSEVQYREPIR